MDTKKTKKIKIAISGKSGCGNTTVSKILSAKLELRFINFTFRNIAQEKGITLEEVLTKAETDDSWDREVDDRQLQYARNENAEKGCVLGSRLAIWFLKEADLKVYLNVNPEIRFERIAQREGGKIEDVTAFTIARDKQDHERYLRLYNIDNDNYSFADMVIDAGILNPEEIVGKIIDKINSVNN
ncbi:MAG: AAA family ATPase [Termitinemataceae bacterium]|nr:MAG: AAA family ATPase [Termitinemataceae bacterium]